MSPGMGWLAALAILLCTGLLTGCAGGDTEAAESTDRTDRVEAAVGDVSDPADREVPVRVETVERRQAVDRALLSADLLPLREATLSAEVAGRVQAVHAREGDRVRAGDVLVEIDTEALAQRLAEAEAVHRQRQTQFERAQALLERQAITKLQFLDAITARDVAVAQLATARLNLERSRVVAPWDGEVATRHVEVGDYASPGQPVVGLLDVARLKAMAAAPATDVPHLRRGLDATVTIDVFPGESFAGRVERLAPALDASTRTLDVEVQIPNGDGRLRPGLAARVSIPRQVFEAAVLVPLDAVLEMGADVDDAVYVVEDGRAARRTVRLGPVLQGPILQGSGTDSRVVVLDGLEAGDQLIVAGQHLVSPGQAVRIEG